MTEDDDNQKEPKVAEVQDEWGVYGGTPNGVTPNDASFDECTCKRGVLACLGALLCPCCFSERHRFCSPFKVTPLGCLGCMAWTLSLATALWLALTFLVLKPIICESLDAEMFPEEEFLEHTVHANPANWEFAGTQTGCTTWVSQINVSDWQAEEGSWKEVFFESTDGLRLHGFWFPALPGLETGNSSWTSSSAGEGWTPAEAPTIIQVHDHGLYAAVQDQMIPAKAMQDRGFNVLIFNTRGLGKSETPENGYAVRSFGADELKDTEGAIRLVTEDPDNALPFVTPLHRVGIFTVAGGNGMVWFFRKNIPGIVMHESIYDWFVRFRHDAGFLAKIPLFDTLLNQCISAKSSSDSFFEENYKNQLLHREVYDPSGRKVLLAHNRANSYNLFEESATDWEITLTRKEFDVSTYFPNEQPPAGEGCNAHTTLFWGPGRRVALQTMCEHWERVFNMTAGCDDVAWFDTMLDSN